VRTPRDTAAAVARLIASQREFYDLRAPDFGDEAVPDRRVNGTMPSGLVSALIDEFAPTGDLLELACGTGSFTRELVRHARSVTAVDASARMLERNRREVGASKVRYVHADIFELQADHRYDAIFFGFWLSHVPPDNFDGFWSFVRSSLRPDGRVAFVDEDDRGVTNDDIHVLDDVPVAPRTLRDGRQIHIIKMYWNPIELEARIRSLDWQVQVRRVGETFLYGSTT
jgi:demethylmenaquinone methyltransferase/2-methoxy-6-polyprenyl-1,4-benzoquinol methylase